MPKEPSTLEIAFMRTWKANARQEWPYPKKQFRFHPKRLWRFDFAWEAHRLAVELEGGVMSFPVKCDKCGEPVERVNKRTGRKERVYAAMGRHTRSAGFQGDCEKYNQATALGWRVLRFTVKDLTESPGETVRLITRVLAEGPVAEVETQGDLFEPMVTSHGTRERTKRLFS